MLNILSIFFEKQIFFGFVYDIGKFCTNPSFKVWINNIKNFMKQAENKVDILSLRTF